MLLAYRRASNASIDLVHNYEHPPPAVGKSGTALDMLGSLAPAKPFFVSPLLLADFFFPAPIFRPLGASGSPAKWAHGTYQERVKQHLAPAFGTMHEERPPSPRPCRRNIKFILHLSTARVFRFIVHTS